MKNSPAVHWKVRFQILSIVDGSTVFALRSLFLFPISVNFFLGSFISLSLSALFIRLFSSFCRFYFHSGSLLVEASSLCYLILNPFIFFSFLLLGFSFHSKHFCFVQFIVQFISNFYFSFFSILLLFYFSLSFHFSTDSSRAHTQTEIQKYNMTTGCFRIQFVHLVLLMKIILCLHIFSSSSSSPSPPVSFQHFLSLVIAICEHNTYSYMRNRYIPKGFHFIGTNCTLLLMKQSLEMSVCILSSI